MAITHTFTATLPAPSATITDGFVFVLTTAWFTNANQGLAGSPIDGGANSIANGGGDMMAFSDVLCTNRLPIHVVTFVAGGSPDALVYVRTSTYEAGDTITIGRDDTQTTQPLPAATYGQYEVYQDRDFNSRLSSLSISDDTGNISGSISSVGTVSLDNTSPLDSGVSINGVAPTGYDLGVNVGDTLGDFTLRAWVKLKYSAASNKTIMAIRSGSDWAWHWRIEAKQPALLIGGSSPNSTGTLTLNQWTYLALRVVGGNVTFYQDGVEQGTLSLSGTRTQQPTINTYIGYYPTNDEALSSIAEVSIQTSVATSSAQLLSEYLNQSDQDNCATMGEDAAFGGGSIDVTSTLGLIDYTSNNTAVSLTGVVDINSTLGLISYSSNNTLIQLSGVVDVSPTLGLITYSSNDANVSLSGVVDVTSTLGLISYESNNAIIQVSGDIQVNPTLGLINYQSNDALVALESGIIIESTLGLINYESIDASVELQGAIDVNSTLGLINYESYNAFVSIGSGQSIGNVTVGFKDNNYSISYKPDIITVNFK